MAEELVRYALHDRVAVLNIDDGKANALSPTLIAALHAGLDRAEREAGAVMLVGRPGRFSAGFDLSIMTSGLEGLRAVLVSRQQQFVTTVTDRLMAYSLGRGLEYYDRPTLRRIVRDAAAGGYRWSSIVTGIVTSPAFQMRRTES